MRYSRRAVERQFCMYNMFQSQKKTKNGRIILDSDEKLRNSKMERFLKKGGGKR